MLSRNRHTFLIKVFALLLIVSILTPAIKPENAIAQTNPITRPKRLAIYYGYPSLVNDANWNVNLAAAEFAKFDIVVFGAGIEETGHGDHDKTKSIIALLSAQNVETYGYIDATLDNNYDSCGNVIGTDTAVAKVAKWDAMGVTGIFWDKAEQGRGVSRDRLNKLIDETHNAGLYAFINAWEPAEIFEDLTACDGSTKTHMQANDLYLAESWLVGGTTATGGGIIQDHNVWTTKANKLKGYAAANPGVRMTAVSMGTNQVCDATWTPDDHFNLSWWGAMMYELDAFGYTEVAFGGSGTCANKLAVAPQTVEANGQTFTSGITHLNSNTKHERSTSLGKITIENNSTTQTGSGSYQGSTYVGEVGFINDSLTHTPQTIQLQRHYANPVVFAQPISYDGANTAVVRITNIQSNRFTLFVHEAPDQDGLHGRTESVSYLVLEAGAWDLSNGARLEVGTVHTNDTTGKGMPTASRTWTQINYTTPFAATPVVMSQVQSNNDSDWVKTRQKATNASSFQVAMEPADSQTTAHGSETIGWFALTTGSGNWDGHRYEASSTGRAVDHNWYSLNFAQPFTTAPRFLGAVGSYNGIDGTAMRYNRNSLSTTGIEIKLEEDTTADAEVDHTTENIRYLAIVGDGLLTGTTVPGLQAAMVMTQLTGGPMVDEEENNAESTETLSNHIFLPLVIK